MAEDTQNNGTFNFDQWLQDNGLEFAGHDNNKGLPLVKDNIGQVKAFDINALMQDLGADPSQIKNIEYNSPKTALQQSPVDIKDRVKLSVGNTSGSINYLKTKFEDARYDEEQGLTVKKDGIWHAVDPNLLGHGSAWDKTKEMVKHGFGLINNPELAADLAELGPEALNTGLTQITGALGATLGAGVGGVAGAAATAPVGGVGAVPGVVAGAATGRALGVAYGGMVSGMVRTSLGRLAGTYEATPSEQYADIGLEALMSFGGEKVTAGVKPGLGKLVNASKNIAKSASEGTKDAISAVVGKMTNAGYPAVRAMIDAPNKVGAAINKAITASGNNVGQAIEHVAEQKRLATERLLQAATEALPRKYGQLMAQLGDQVDEVGGFTLNFKKLVGDTFLDLEEQGFGKAQSVSRRSLLDDGSERITFKNLRLKFFTDKQAHNRIGEETVETIDREQKILLRPLMRELEAISKQAEKSGSGAVRAVKEWEKRINKIVSDLHSDTKISESTKRLADKISGSFRNKVTSAFDDQGFGEAHAKMAKLYSDYGDGVRQARKILQSDKGLETLTNQLASPPGRNSAAKSLRDNIVSLVGPAGDAMVDNIRNLHAAEKLLPRAPALGLFQIGTSAGFGAAVGGPGLATIVGAGGVLGSSPRFMGRAIQYAKQPMDAATRSALAVGNQALDFLKSRTPEQIKQLISNDDLFKAFVRPLVTSEAQESQLRDHLLSMVEGNGQQ